VILSATIRAGVTKERSCRQINSLLSDTLTDPAGEDFMWHFARLVCQV
jgi:hypothetical protein